jgi:large subunit ribosomal protein L6
MTRIGKLPIPVPEKVTIDIQKNEVTVKGPNGELRQIFSPELTVTMQDGQVVVQRSTDNRRHKALHGLTRSLLNNMVIGVTNGFSQHLRIEGVGYRAQMDGRNLILNVGYSHPVMFEGDDSISYEVDRTGRAITIRGIDKQLVGEVAARIRRTRPPEPYKGKGIRYENEVVRRKAGKSGKK